MHCAHKQSETVSAFGGRNIVRFTDDTVVITRRTIQYAQRPHEEGLKATKGFGFGDESRILDLNHANPDVVPF